MKYALINKNNGKIENIIIWDGLAPIDLASNIQAELCTPVHENLWSVQNYVEPIELNEEQKLLQLLLEKYGGTDSPLGLS
jgi:hypothetical protein